VNLGRKDLGLAIDLAKDFDVPVQYGPLSWKEYDETSKRDRGLLDTGAVALIQEERAGVEIRADMDAK
jgi:3-hydroxyisobutyrate dehydrogenase-like beta-hydroxyacid dehydrogenase